MGEVTHLGQLVRVRRRLKGGGSKTIGDVRHVTSISATGQVTLDDGSRWRNDGYKMGSKRVPVLGRYFEPYIEPIN